LAEQPFPFPSQVFPIIIISPPEVIEHGESFFFAGGSYTLALALKKNNPARIATNVEAV